MQDKVSIYSSMKLGSNIFLLFLVINLSGNSCERIIAIGSRFISPNSTYTAFVLTHKTSNNATVSVGFNQNSMTTDSKSFENFKEISFHEVDFHVSSPIANSKLTAKFEALTKCMQQSVDLINTETSPIIFIQFDKPIYKAGDLFKFQVFVLDRKMLPLLDHVQVSAYITDATNSHIVTDLKKEDKFGVYEGTASIPQAVKPGLWKINVQVDDRKVSKTFQVQQRQQSDEEVLIEMQDVVAFVDRKIYLILHIKEPSGRSANIKLDAKFENASINEISKYVKSQDLKSTKTVFQLDFHDDLTIRFPTADMILKFTVDVIHAATRMKTQVEKEILMRHEGRNTIQIIRKKYFKPGFKYPIKARIKILDGKPDNSLNHLATNITFVSKANKAEVKTYQTNLKNGETIYNLEPKTNTQKILISMEFADTIHTEEVSVFPGAKEYMQVSVLTKSPSVGSKVQIQVKSTEEMEELHLIVFGSNGIVFHENFPDSIQKDIFEINLVVTNEMKPEARGLVFYSRLIDGALVYDEFSINLGFSIDNSLEITAEPSADPDTLTNVQVKTEEGSRVYLIAINANSALISRDNEISRTSIYEEITYFLNEKYPLSESYHFDKINGFILEPLIDGEQCFGPRFGFNTNSNDDILEPEPKRTKRSITTVQKFYPEVLPEIKYIAGTSETEMIQIKFPDITATWRIFGISVHPTKGFTVAKTQPEISVKGTIKHKVELEFVGTTSVKQDEMHKITIIAFNLNPTNLQGKVSITAEDGYLHLGNEVPLGNKKCINEKRENRLEFNVQFTPQKSSKSAEFFISATSLNQIKLKATFIGEIPAETSKLIDVNEQKELKTTVISNELVESPHYTFPELPENASYYATFASIHGNLLGPALIGLEEICGQSMHLKEEKVLKFAMDVLICKYFDFIRDSYHLKARAARERIAEDGPKVVDILKSIKDPKKNLGKLAFITGILIDATGYYNDQISISETLEFIKNQQYYRYSTGKYDYYPENDNHKDISSTARNYIQIASIVAVMSKDPQYRQQYRNEIRYSLDYLNKNSIKDSKSFNGDHIVSMTAYAYALNGYQYNAEAFLNILKHGYKNPSRYEKHYSMYVQALSYIILTKVLVGQDPKEQVEWLLTYRNPDGGFFSPYDTVLALQALYEYTRYRRYPLQPFIFRVDGRDNYYAPSESVMNYKLENFMYRPQTSQQLLGYVNFYQKYFDNTPTSNSISKVETFVKKVRNQDSFEININYQFKTLDRELGNSIITLEVDLPVGYIYYNPRQEVVGYKNDGKTLVFHLTNKEKNKIYSQIIIVVKDPNVESYYKPLTIKFYDYYRPNIKDTYKYNVKCTIN